MPDATAKNPHGRARRCLGLVLLVLLFLLAEAAVLFPSVLFRGETFSDRDLATYDRANKSLVPRLVHETAGLPLWNPYFASGQPFAANPKFEIFHPLTALFLVLPFEVAFRLQVVLPVLLAGPAMWFFLRTRGLSPPAALLGAASWGVGGLLLSTTSLLPILFSVSVLPAGPAFALRALRGGAGRDIGGLAVTVGWIALAGEPTSLIAALALGATALAEELLLGREGSRPAIRRLAFPGTGLALGLLLGAATLVPGARLYARTVRAAGLPPELADDWSLPPLRLAEIAVPDLFGHIERTPRDWYWGGRLYGERRQPYFFSICTGLLVAVLALVEWLRRPGAGHVWLVAALTGALLAFGANAPAWPLARSSLPLFSGLRFPEKFVLWTVFAVTVAGASGLDRLREGGGSRLAAGLLGASFLAGLGAAMAALVWTGSSGAAGWVRLGLAPTIAREAGRVVAADALRLSVLAGAGLILVRRLGRAPLAAWGLVAATAADLLFRGGRLVGTVPAETLATPPPFLAALSRTAEGPGLLFHLAAWTAPVPVQGALASPPMPAFWGVPVTLEADFDLTELAWSAAGMKAFWKAVGSEPGLMGPLLSRRGVTAVASLARGVRSEGDRLLVPGGTAPVVLRGVADARPFAFCADAVGTVRGEDGWVEAVRRLGAPSARTALLDARDLPRPPEAVSPCAVEVARPAPTRIVLRVRAAGPDASFVALNQTWDDGWTLQLDGAPAALLRTDVSLSGFFVPPGSHRAEVVYSDRSVTCGVLVSLSALAATVLLAVRRRRDPVP